MPHPSLPRLRGRVREGARLGQRDAVDAHRSRYVFDLLFAEILKAEIEYVAHLVAHDAADADAAGLGQCFQPRGDIDAVAINVLFVDDDVAKIDADAELDMPLFGEILIAQCHLAL